MTLARHGSYTIAHQDNILLVDAKGPFNQMIMTKYQEKNHSICEQLKSKPWGSLVTYHGNEIFNPDAEQALIEMTQYRVKHNMVANATVILDSNHADLQQMQLRRIYQSSKIVFHVFSDFDSAKNWLSTFLDKKSYNK